MSERRYGQWAGNPTGDAENKTQCVEQVYSKDTMLHHQCALKRGHGPGGLYCKMHGRKAEVAA